MTRTAGRRRTVLRLLACLACLAPAWGLTPPAPAGEQTSEGRAFSLPDGFALERAAGPPLVDRPITADFDERGRLYVADSSGSNDKAADQLARKPHRIVRLEDTDGDGRFDRRTVFADKMMFPEGTLWYDGSLYVAAPPSIWKLTDTDGDGVADVRVEWFQGKTLTGCANDLHGPYLGPDGWIYWCKGAFASQTYERPGKAPFVTRASHVFRARPDGTGIEPVMTGGMDNPVDVAFTPGGERVVSGTFLVHPGGGRRDGLLHAVYGGVYGKVHDVLDGHIRTGPGVLPVLSHLGPAAPCGLTAYESDAWGEPYRDNLFTCCFNLRKVTRHVLTRDGATFFSRDEDFLTSADHDFHPTDVLEDADGSLIVVDTGGWYKLCCPTSQLPKPDVLGAIYRVRKTGAAKVEDPRGLKLEWPGATPADLAARLGDPRPAVRRRAVHELGKKGAAAVPAVAKVDASDNPEARRNAVRAATRIEHPDARQVCRRMLLDSDPSVRRAAIHSAGLWRDRAALPELRNLLERPSAHDRRAAAEAIGRVGDASAVAPLLAAAGETVDPILTHSLTYALIEIGDAGATARCLPDPVPGRSASLDPRSRARRAALVALDQMGGSSLTPDQVTPDLSSDDPATRETAAWVIGRHPGWAGAVAVVLKRRLAGNNARNELDGQLARFAREKAVQALMAEALLDKTAPVESRRVVLHAMARSGLKDVPARWVEGLTATLSDPGLANDATHAIRALPITRGQATDLIPALFRLEGKRIVTDLAIYSAVPGGLSVVTPAQFAFLRGLLGSGHDPEVHSSAANVLARATLDSGQLLALADDVAAASPLEIDRLLTVFEQSTDVAVGLRLLDALKRSKARGSLRVETLRPRLDRFGGKVRQEAEAFYSSLNVSTGEQAARLEAVLPALAGGDVRRGQAVFNGAKAGCLTCHAVGYVGGKVGPDLTAIGQVRTERDLLESVLFPSLSFVRSYEPVTVATRDGKVVNGILRDDPGDDVVLAVNATEEVRIARDRVEEMRPGTVSVMPAGLDQQLTRQELADLIAFLKSRK